MQNVLWFVGLRGAIAFALSENMPGPNKEIYATATLSICIFTTVVCGGFTERILTMSGMKETGQDVLEDVDEEDRSSLVVREFPVARRASEQMRGTVKEMWRKFDNEYLKVYFGGSVRVQSGVQHMENGRNLGNYELTHTGSRGLSDDAASDED
jgi:sodium/hydrogen exchanger 8